MALGDGKVVLVCNTNELCERENLVLRALRAQRIAGLIIAPAGQGGDYGIELASRIPQRTVVIDRHIPFLERDFVCLDNRAAGRMITEYLLRLGHRRIGFIGGREGVSTAVERFEGFAEALRDRGATLDPSLCIDANYRSELANRAAVEMLTRTDRPSAIVAANNLTTLGVMQAVSALGFDCPNDVSVAGIDNSPWNIALRPPLTSVAQPIQAIGRQAIDWFNRTAEQPRGHGPSFNRFPARPVHTKFLRRSLDLRQNSSRSRNPFETVVSAVLRKVRSRQPVAPLFMERKLAHISVIALRYRPRIRWSYRWGPRASALSSSSRLHLRLMDVGCTERTAPAPPHGARAHVRVAERASPAFGHDRSCHPHEQSPASGRLPHPDQCG